MKKLGKLLETAILVERKASDKEFAKAIWNSKKFMGSIVKCRKQLESCRNKITETKGLSATMRPEAMESKHIKICWLQLRI